MSAPDPGLVREAFRQVADALLASGRVAVDGFGVFDLHRRKPRLAGNPRTGERINVPATTVVRFRPAAALKARVRG